MPAEMLACAREFRNVRTVKTLMSEDRLRHVFKSLPGRM